MFSAHSTLINLYAPLLSDDCFGGGGGYLGLGTGRELVVLCVCASVAACISFYTHCTAHKHSVKSLLKCGHKATSFPFKDQ